MPLFSLNQPEQNVVDVSNLEAKGHPVCALIITPMRLEYLLTV